MSAVELSSHVSLGLKFMESELHEMIQLYNYAFQPDAIYEGVSKSFRTEPITKYTLTTNKHWLRSNAKGCGDETHKTDSQNSDTTAPSGRKLYHLQFILQAAGPETFGYTLLQLQVVGWTVNAELKEM
jgi:hypothetical protein